MRVHQQTPADRKFISGYGNGGFRINEAFHAGSILLFADRFLPWHITDYSALDLESLTELMQTDPPVELLLIGCGPQLRHISDEIRAPLRQRGTVIEPMDTGAACRTYNLLLTEERRVAAALIAVD